MEFLEVQIDNILGFEHVRAFRFFRYKEEPPFFVLEAKEDEVSFLLTDPFHFFDYHMTISDEVQKKLEVTSQEDLLALVIVRIHQETGELTANLLGPVILNLRTKKGAQVILPEENLSTKQPLPVKLTLPCSS